MPDFSDEGEGTHRAKVALRRELLARRRALSAADRAVAADRVRVALTTLVRRRRPRLVAGYVPVGGEPGGDLPAVLAGALPAGGRLLLPVLRADLDLDWAEYRDPGKLVAAGRGLREPAGPRWGVAAVADVDLVVVPALAVDRRGTRLGRGGGSYDRALARVPARTLVVALLHDGELVDAVPAEPHDRPVDGVITPAGGWLPLPGHPRLDVDGSDDAPLALG